MSYLVGSLMFSFYLGKIKGINIRNIGDGNPGAANVFKACGWPLGILAALLDFGKGFLPVYIIYQVYGIRDFRAIPIALAVVLGHAFSIFMQFGGGKAIAVTFGIWAGLTLWQMPIVLGLGLLFLKFVLGIKNDGYNIVFGMLVSSGYFAFKFDWILVIIFTLNFLIIVYKHRSVLKSSLR
ncbi:MAG: glycerol-3-phosphate acyltransferase [candidate division WOR-3 bacterium]